MRVVDVGFRENDELQQRQHVQDEHDDDVDAWRSKQDGNEPGDGHGQHGGKQRQRAWGLHALHACTEDGDDEVDDWDKVEEEEDWDPDFDEFDIPKSKGKKAAPSGKKSSEEEEDFKIDDEFKDMFNESDGFDEEEEDY